MTTLYPCYPFKRQPHLKISRFGPTHSMCTHTGPLPSVITVERCCSDWSDKGSSVTVRKIGRWSVNKKRHYCTNFSKKWILTLIKYAPSPPLSYPLVLWSNAAPCRMWTKLPQALCVQHPKQLQWSSQKASVHHLPEQQPVPASLHHWVSVQCRDGLHLHRGHQPYSLTHSNGTDGFMHTILWSVLDY